MSPNIEIKVEQLNQNVVELYSCGKYAQAQVVAKQALELVQQLWGQEHPNVATSLNNLAEISKALGHYTEACSLHEQALEIRKSLLGSEHPDVANSMNNLAFIYYYLRRDAEAETLYEKSLQLTRRLWGNEHLYVAKTLNNLALLYHAQQRYSEAERFYKKTLELMQRLGGSYTDVAGVLNNLANLYSYFGRYTEVESLYRQAFNLWIDNLGEEHPYVAMSLNDLARFYHDQGRYSDAERLYIQALDLRRRLLGDEHPDVAGNLNDLAVLYHDQGRYSDAERLYIQALDLRRRLLGNEHSDVAVTLQNLAGIYGDRGRYKDAEILMHKVLCLQGRLLREEHPLIALSLNNLARLYCHQRQYEEAEHLCTQALNMRKRLLGNEHPSVASSLNNLASIFYCQQNYSAAETFLKQALEMIQRLFGKRHFLIAHTLNNLGVLYYAQGCYSKAETLIRKAVSITESAWDNEHPEIATSLNNLTAILTSSDRFYEALTQIQRANEIYDRTIYQVFATSCETDRLAYLQRIRGNFDMFLSLIVKHLCDSAEAVHTALDLVFKRKALSAAALAAQNQALYSGRYPHLTEEFRELRSLSDRIVHLTFSTPQEKKLSHYKQHLTQLQIRYEGLQKRLASGVPEVQLQEQLKTTDRRAVALEMPEGSTLVEFVCFRVFDFKAVPARGQTQWQPLRYLAFILPAKQPDQVQMIDLGDAQHIDRLIRCFRFSVLPADRNPEHLLEMGEWDDDLKAEPMKYNPEAAIALTEAIFAPLRHTLQGYNHLILAPDGNLNLLPFQLLPTDDTGKRLLMDEYRISYLSVGRDILRSQIQPSRPASEPLVMADPDFDWGSSEPAKAGFACVDAVSTAPSLSPELLTGQSPFRRAPGTRFLGERVAKTLNVTPYLGSDALEPHLTKAQSPRIMLLATHGVFWADSEEKPPSCDRPLFQMSDRFSTAKADNPMMRSGLALAGANRWLSGDSLPPEAGKGFLFAQDIAILDLWATELTVLSACNTAMGDVKIGEGVFGMRRAFAVAGCKTLVMSLWPVPDKATALLMDRFFENLRAGLGRADALQAAQNYIRTVTIQGLRQSALGMEVLAELPSGNVRVDRDDSTPLAHPFYWGAWVCQGETAPMEREDLEMISAAATL